LVISALVSEPSLFGVEFSSFSARVAGPAAAAPATVVAIQNATTRRCVGRIQRVREVMPRAFRRRATVPIGDDPERPRNLT
jgi:hypothetical protein